MLTWMITTCFSAVVKQLNMVRCSERGYPCQRPHSRSPGGDGPDGEGSEMDRRPGRLCGGPLLTFLSIWAQGKDPSCDSTFSCLNFRSHSVSVLLGEHWAVTSGCLLQGALPSALGPNASLACALLRAPRVRPPPSEEPSRLSAGSPGLSLKVGGQKPLTTPLWG